MTGMPGPRRWIIAGAALLAVVLGGAVVDGGDRPADPRSVPDSALLRPEDVGGAAVAEGGPDLATHGLLPRPCDGVRPTEPLDSRVQHVTAAGAHLVYAFVGRYAPGTAAQVADDLREAVNRCPDGPGDIRHRIAATDRWGPHSTLLTREWEAGRRRDAYLIAVAGDLLVVVLDTGDGSLAAGDPATAAAIGAAAIRRAGGDPAPVPPSATTLAPSPAAGTRWMNFAADVTGVRAGRRPDAVIVELAVPAGGPDCARAPQVSRLTEENNTVYANVTVDTFENEQANRCPGRAPATVELVAARPLGDRPLLLNSLQTWARDGKVYRICRGPFDCTPPRVHCNDAWFHSGDLPAAGYRDLKGCDGRWAVLDINATAGACGPPATGAGPGCTAEPRWQRHFLRYSTTWRSVDDSPGPGCAGVHAAEPGFPRELCADLPALP